MTCLWAIIYGMKKTYKISWTETDSQQGLLYFDEHEAAAEVFEVLKGLGYEVFLETI